jgi:hypothetical protein
MGLKKTKTSHIKGCRVEIESMRIPKHMTEAKQVSNWLQ